MTPHEIVALRCPSCGGGITQPSREMPFGAEFRCDRCGITSVLIIDRALVPLSSLQKQGEKVCTACGRVAQREARFCQEGHALVRTCIKCLREFAVDHQRCDSCGWPQSVKPGTVEGEALAFDRAVSDLADPSDRTVEYALKVIIAGRGTASSAAMTAAVSAILSRMMDFAFRGKSIILSAGEELTEMAFLDALATLGPAARQAVPMLRQRMEEIWPLGWEGGRLCGRHRLLLCLGAISPEDALAYCDRILEEVGKNDSVGSNNAVKVAFALGKAAIPILEKFCGPFSGERGRLCKAAISALRNGEPSLRLP